MITFLKSWKRVFLKSRWIWMTCNFGFYTNRWPECTIHGESRATWGHPAATNMTNCLALGSKSLEKQIHSFIQKYFGCFIYIIYKYIWASLVAQMVKSLLAMQETWIWSLSWEDSLEESMATYSSILTWRIPTDRGAWRAIIHVVTKSQTWWRD